MKFVQQCLNLIMETRKSHKVWKLTSKVMEICESWKKAMQFWLSKNYEKKEISKKKYQIYPPIEH